MQTIKTDISRDLCAGIYQENRNFGEKVISIQNRLCVIKANF
jgi:hypothetical protein